MMTECAYSVTKDVGASSFPSFVGKTAHWLHPVSLQLTQRVTQNSDTVSEACYTRDHLSKERGGYGNVLQPDSSHLNSMNIGRKLVFLNNK